MIKKYNEFINEGIFDLLSGYSISEIKEKISKLSSDKIIDLFIKNKNLKISNFLSKEEIDSLIRNYILNKYKINDDDFLIELCLSLDLFEYLPRNKNNYCVYNSTMYLPSSKSLHDITKLPENLLITKDLVLSENIKKLPNGLIVKGDLECDMFKTISELPNDLVVGKNLYISYQDIEEIPSTIEVGGTIYITGTSLINKDLPKKFKYFK